MERAMSVEERIRKAEDIYNRRNGIYSRSISQKSDNKNKSKKSTTKRLLMQAFVCLSIYVVFYAVTNREYIFSEQFRNEVNAFFTEKTKISEFFENTKNFVYSKFNKSDSETSEQNNSNKSDSETSEQNNSNNSDNENSKQNNSNNSDNENSEQGGKEENETNSQNEKANQDNSNVQNITSSINEQMQNNNENIGGALDGNENKELSEQEQMEKDAKEIKEKIKFIVPVKGRISSTFGWRNPTTATVPKYHTGTDIAANEGTVIKSATDGKVIMASTKGDYGNHYQIQIDDVIIVYAHCKRLYLKEGDTVKQGQEIAEVGSTGNSTGPHLHFEIRRNGRKIDPQLVLNL